MINVHSPTWRAIEKFIDQQRAAAISDLIADFDSDKQRGIISVLDKLKALPEESKPQPVIQDDYN